MWKRILCALSLLAVTSVLFVWYIRSDLHFRWSVFRSVDEMEPKIARYFLSVAKPPAMSDGIYGALGSRLERFKGDPIAAAWTSSDVLRYVGRTAEREVESIVREEKYPEYQQELERRKGREREEYAWKIRREIHATLEFKEEFERRMQPYQKLFNVWNMRKSILRAAQDSTLANKREVVKELQQELIALLPDDGT